MGAVFDSSRRYRYRLWRIWGNPRRRVVFVMLNPSTADARRLDPTTTRCARFAQLWGYGGFEAVNLFALRATHPAALRRHPDPIGPRTDAVLRRVAQQAALLVFAWGNHGSWLGRSQAVASLLPAGHCFGYTLQGQPKHPLYLPADSTLVPYPRNHAG